MLDGVDTLGDTSELVLAIGTSGGRGDNRALVVQKSDGDSLKWSVTGVVVINIHEDLSTDGSLE